jgi:hypothetical protein
MIPASDRTLYLTRQADALHAAIQRDDPAAVKAIIGHVRREADLDAADWVVEQATAFRSTP